ncbi:MAG: hypothetical protein ACLGRW_02375 [Acidobacteriota bacterium]|jgi:hypothetical protein
MRFRKIFGFLVLTALALMAPQFVRAAPAATAEQAANQPVPDVRQLMMEVEQHQRQLEKVRENYTYTALMTIQDVDAGGQVKKTESVESDDFFVNGHLIERTVKKNGQPLSGHDLEKENARVTKLVEKAEQTPSSQRLDQQTVTVGRLLQIMDVNNPRRETFRGRPTIVFDFRGRKHVKTHGLAEDASKKLQGTLWIDESDRQVAHLEVSFVQDFRIGAGLLATVKKGSNFSFDQAPVSNGLWLPTGAEGNMQARLLLLKGIRQHLVEHDYGFKVFQVTTQQAKHAEIVPPASQ